MNANKLKYVVAVDRFGSLTAAAEVVHITQSALTKAIADVEQEVGFALFERRSRGVVATAEGRAFLDRAARVVEDLEQLVADARSARGLQDLKMRVGVCPPSLVSLLNIALPTVLTRHPGVCIEQTAGWIDQSVHHLANRDIDLLVGPEPQISRYSDQFTLHPLPPLDICFFARKGHPLCRLSEIRVAQLSDYPMALADRSVASPELICQLFGQREVPADKQLHIINHFSSACRIVASSDTIGTVAASYRRNAAFLRKFSPLDTVDSVAPVPLVAAYHSRFLPSAPISTLVGLLETEAHWAAK